MKKIFFAAVLLVCAIFAGAQTIHDPNGEIYRDIERWSVQGYIKEFLPVTRPYPMPVIDAILDQVAAYGDTEAQNRAAAYREVLAPGARFIHPGFESYLDGKNSEYGFIGGPFAEGAFRLNSILNGSYNLTFYGLTDEAGGNFNVPGTYSPYQDFVYDVSNIGKIQIAQNWTSLFSIGNSNIYFQGGLARASYGPFYDNGVVVGPQAPRAGHFGFVYRQPRWSFEILYMAISASDDFGTGIFPNKSLIIHTINFRPVQKLELGFTQSLVWGGRMELLYLVPFTFLFASQTIIDFDDNAQLGLYFNWKPFNTFNVKGIFYADDISFNGFFTGDMKIKAAGELGITWAPFKSVLSRLDFDYTAVFPYTYTHWSLPKDYIYEKGKPNYMNYTHLGKNIGPDLEPNSDRVSVRSSWNTFKGVDLNVSGYLIRHANASAGKDDITGSPVYGTPGEGDGSIFDHGTATLPGSDTGAPKYDMNPHIYGWYLTQDLIESRLGCTIGISWKYPTKFGVFSLTGEYGAEYGWNRGLADGDKGLDHFWSVGGKWVW